MLSDPEIELIRQARLHDPFFVLGVQADAEGRLWLRVMLPHAAQVAVLDADSGELLASLRQRHPDGIFEGLLPGATIPDYRLQVRWDNGHSTLCNDPYRFAPVLGDLDLWLLGEGTHLRPYEVLGATPRTLQGVGGTCFAVWAPNAVQVSVVGDFNLWDGRRHSMRPRGGSGVWEIFVPEVGAGALYKFQVRAPNGEVLPLKSDPYALQVQAPPGTASVVAQAPLLAPPCALRRRANAPDAPISIYQAHLGSWRRKPEESDRVLTWNELADTLVPYATEMGFTHVGLLPIGEHSSGDASSSAPTGLFAPTARFGPAAGLRRFIERAHDAGLGVLLDWVPTHFSTDPHGLGRFDGTPLYEAAGSRAHAPHDANAFVYDLGRPQVGNFLVSNALFWLERYGVDGLRVDALTSLLYPDDGRAFGDETPGRAGGRESPAAVAFLRRLNSVVGELRPQAVMAAEESTGLPGVTRPAHVGGLGFHCKWNQGWMHDTLAYMARDPIHRRHHHHEITLGLTGAFSDNFVLPMAHDDAAPGHGSLLARMPGDRTQKFANLRAYCGFMFGHPGKKLLFMGCEFAQAADWNPAQSLDWHLLDDPLHDGMRRLVRDLNVLYRSTPALHQRDFLAEGFEWIDPDDAERSVLAFVRRGADADALVVVACNFTPVARRGFRVGVPQPGVYRERLNTDSAFYGGGDFGTPLGAASAEPFSCHGKPHSIVINLPPLATVMFEWTRA